MSLGAALQVMGAPDRVESLKWEPHYFEIRDVPSLDQVPYEFFILHFVLGRA